jgi:hypothetical protein
MKAKSSKNEESVWVMQASSLLKRIKEARVPLDPHFPQKEYLQPLEHLTGEKRTKVIEFLCFDIAQLVPVSDLDFALREAILHRVAEGQILHAELKKINENINDLKSTISHFAALGHRSYAEAKALFADVLKTGMWIEEANFIRKIIQVNKKIETLLAENDHNCFTGLREISDNEGKYIDAAFKKTIASRFREISHIQKQLDRVFTKPSLEFADFEPIEKLVKECSHFPFFIPNYEQLQSLYKSFIWVLELGVNFDLKTGSLSNLVNQLITKIKYMKEKGDLKDKREKLGEAAKFSYVQQPINKLVHECRFLIWDNDVRNYLSRPFFKREELKSLLDRAPTMLHGQSGPPVELLTIKNLVDRAKIWESDAERIIRQTTELRTCDSDVFNKRMSSSGGQIEEAILKAKEEYKNGLKQIEEFHVLKSALEQSEKILTMSKCVYRVANVKKIDHADYQKAKELFKDSRSKEFMKENLFQAFRKLILMINNEVKLLKEIYLKIAQKEAHATPLLFEPKFLEYAKDLHKVNAASKALAKAENYIYLGDFGTTIKTFIADFVNAESSLLVMYNDHPYAQLSTYDMKTLQDILDEFSARKQKWRIRLYSDYLEELARFEWLLHSLLAIRSDQAQLETLEKLHACSEIAIQDDRHVVQQLQKKISTGKELVSEIEAVLNSADSHTIEDLKTVRRKLEESQTVVKGLKKRIENEYRAFELLDYEYKMARETDPDGRISSLDELRGLLKDAMSLKYKAPTIEKSLKISILNSEKLLEYIRESKPYQEILELIEKYRTIGVRVLEIEVILRNREIALEFLQQDDLPIEKMIHKELRIVEKSIVNSLDLSFQEKFSTRILQRRFNLLLQLEKKGPDPGDENKIKMKDLIEIHDEMKAKASLFSSDDLDYIQEKLLQSKMYIEQMKRVKEETLKKCQRVLFNFLDISDEIKQIHKSFHPSASTLDRLLKSQPEHATDRRLEATRYEQQPERETLDKEERKALRIECIKNIRTAIQEGLPELLKDDCKYAAMSIEQAIYTRNKPSFLDYRKMIQDYIQLIEKCQQKPFLIELFISKPLLGVVVEHLLEDQSPEFNALEDPVEARRYIRAVERSLTVAADPFASTANMYASAFPKTEEEEGSIGKRLLPSPFLDEEIAMIQGAQKRTKEWSDQKSSQNYSLYENISLDNSTNEVRRTFTFGKSNQQVVDMEEIDDEDSYPLSSGSSQPNQGQEIGAQAAKEIKDFLEEDTSFGDVGKEGTEPQGLWIEDEQGNSESHRDPSDSPDKEPAKDPSEGFEAMVQDISEQKEDHEKRKMLDELEVKSNMQIELVEAKHSPQDWSKKQQTVHLQAEEKAQIRRLSADCESMDVENPNDSSQGDQIKPWEIFRGTLKFNVLKKTVPEVKLIALSSSSSLGNAPDFNREAVIVEEHFLPREFEREVERLKPKILKQDMVVASGFVFTNSNMNKVLFDIRNARSSIHYSNIREGVRLYLIGANEVIPYAKFMFEEYSELEKINCEFLWLLVFENKVDFSKRIKPKLFTSAISYKVPQDKAFVHAAKGPSRDQSKHSSGFKAADDRAARDPRASERVA